MIAFRTGLYLHLRHRHLPVSEMASDKLRSFRTRVQPRHRSQTETTANLLQAHRCLLPPRYRLDRMVGLHHKLRQLEDLRTLYLRGPTLSHRGRDSLSGLTFLVQPTMVLTVVTKVGVCQMSTVDQNAPAILYASAKLRQDAADVNYLVAELLSDWLRQLILESGLGETLENMTIVTCALLHEMHERHPYALQHGILETLEIHETSETNVIDRIPEVMLCHLQWSLDGCLPTLLLFMNIRPIGVKYPQHITHVIAQNVAIMAQHACRNLRRQQHRKDRP
jgi:hypothetical protein